METFKRGDIVRSRYLKEYFIYVDDGMYRRFGSGDMVSLVNPILVAGFDQFKSINDRTNFVIVLMELDK